MIQNNSLINVFWGLNESWWKQVYDASYHQFGSQVFDEGLHDGNIEPGFYSSIKNANEYAAKQLNKPLTIECYKKIHELACAHFHHVARNAINVDKENIDNFRDTSCNCYKNLYRHPDKYETALQTEKRKLRFALLHGIRWSVLMNDKISTETGSKEELDKLLSPQIKERLINSYSGNQHFSKQGIDVKDLFENGNPIYEQAIISKEKVTKQLEATQKRLNLIKPFAKLKINASGKEILVNIDYNYQDPTEIEKVIHILIDDYNEKIQKFSSNLSERSKEENELALSYIAELFQNLEWLHPFFDGQGRTDLSLLAKLLTENGFNPSILYDPYYSTFEPLENWISYLKNGIETWKREKEMV